VDRPVISAPTRLDPDPAAAPLHPAAFPPAPTARLDPTPWRPVIAPGPPDPVAGLPHQLRTRRRRRPAFRAGRRWRRRAVRSTARRAVIRAASRRRAVARAAPRWTTRRRAIGLRLGPDSERQGSSTRQHTAQKAAPVQHHAFSFPGRLRRPEHCCKACGGEADQSHKWGSARPALPSPSATSATARRLHRRCRKLHREGWRSQGGSVTNRGSMLPPR